MCRESSNMNFTCKEAKTNDKMYNYLTRKPVKQSSKHKLVLPTFLIWWYNSSYSRYFFLYFIFLCIQGSNPWEITIALFYHPCSLRPIFLVHSLKKIMPYCITLLSLPYKAIKLFSAKSYKWRKWKPAA